MENKDNAGKDKIRVLVVVMVTLLLASTLVIYAVTLVKQGKSVGALFPGIIFMVVLVFMVPFLKRRYFDVKKGYPFEDEMSNKILLNATSKAFTLSIYWMLALMVYTGIGVEEYGYPELIPRHVAVAGILGMAVIFGLSYAYVSWKGVVE